MNKSLSHEQTSKQQQTGWKTRTTANISIGRKSAYIGVNVRDAETPKKKTKR